MSDTVTIVCYCPRDDCFVKTAVHTDAVGIHGCMTCGDLMEVYVAQGAKEVVAWNGAEPQPPTFCVCHENECVPHCDMCGQCIYDLYGTDAFLDDNRAEPGVEQIVAALRKELLWPNEDNEDSVRIHNDAIIQALNVVRSLAREEDA